MKKIFVFIMLVISIINDLSAENNEKRISSEIKNVTVFLNGAQISREASVNLSSGTSQIIFENLSSYVVSSSLQAKGEGNFTILSVSYQLNYLQNKIKTKEIKELEDSSESIKYQMDFINGQIKVYDNEEAMVLANKSIGGSNVGVNIISLKDATEFFRSRLSDLNSKKLSLRLKYKLLEDKLTKITNQLNQINNENNIPTGEIIVTINSKANSNAKLSVNYFVNNAGWVPYYDARATDVNNPIKLVYKANVFQNTGENWNNVKLTLSTGNPTTNDTKPEVFPWYIRFADNYSNSTNRGGYYNSMDAKKMSVAAPAMAMDYSAKEKTIEANSSADFTQVNENQTNTEFEISIPYSILSDGKYTGVDIQEYKLPASYEYYSIPKIDKDAFLLAKINDWEQYNLLSGEMNIFYEDTYIGKSYLNTRETKDTLDISLGRDKNIVVTRIKLKDFTSKQFIGLNKKEMHGWEINVKNKKSQPIDITIIDQFPISTDKDIEIDRIESTNAAFDNETGKLTWKAKLNASESKKYIVKYSIKYPKDKTISK